MKCEVKYFGRVGELLNKNSEIIELDVFISDKDDLAKSFLLAHPILKTISFKVAVDDTFLNQLPEKDISIIALLPPFAGG